MRDSHQLNGKGTRPTGRASNNGPRTQPPAVGLRMIVAHPNDVYRLGVRSIMSGLDSGVIVEEAADMAVLQELLDTVKPDVIVVDALIANTLGTDSSLVDIVRASAPHVGVILIVDADDPGIERAIEQGVDACLMRTAGVQEFAAALRVVGAGGHYIQADLIGVLMNGMRAARPTARLTARQVTMIGLVSRGYSNTQIASELGTSLTSVKSDLKLIYSQLDVSNRAEAAAAAVRFGVVA
jgi:DNA-binding NarL/FixJ family response regulator